MKIKFLHLSVLFSFFALTASAQIDNPFSSGDAPKAELGKCYAKCYIPSQYETTTEKVLVKPSASKLKVVPAVFETVTDKVLVSEASTKLVVVPAEYETTTEKVMIQEASTKLVVVPAEYETATEKVMIQEASTKLVAVPAEYETTTEKVLIKEASTRWTMKKDKNCMSANPDDCFVACFEEIPEQYTTYTSSVLKTPATTKTIDVPAKYKTVTKKVVKTPATTKTIDVPAKYKTITKKVLKKPATTKTIDVPAKYTTITKKVLKTPATTSSIDTEAKYETITKRKLVKAGEYSDWREVLCSGDVTSDINRQIQNALMAKGYDIGPAGADNILGGQSRAALMQYQRDNNLPVGNLNKETLDHLGVKY